ncbi:mitochondrial calcium uniporter isoform X1 [Rhynchophorus ferrugineus]|uniref:mitochondrial calcium uniporter isoform X1 n=1 Tax=Rhynchophorus ferrugineus TaxID=354439 RepID=UPI003FCD0839
MAILKMFCRARPLLNNDLLLISKHTPLINTIPINKFVEVQVIRQFRTNFSVNLVTKENNKNKDGTPAASSSDSDLTDDESDIEVELNVEYHKGLPKITVPLPSRKERCSFVLKPISNTVGDFLDMLKREDKGIDRVVCKSQDGTRIASSNTIETLLDEDFKLIINDNSYNVSTPKDERLSTEEVQNLADIKTIVNRLYQALHVDEHQVSKEKELLAQLETLKLEVQPLETQKIELEQIAQKRSNWLAWAGLGMMSVQFGILARLTWWEYSWDIMEPVTYFVTYGTAMACYAYFVLTKEEYILGDVKDRQHLLTVHKKAKKTGLDLDKYNYLKDEMYKVEYKLKKLRNPLKLNLPSKTNKSTNVDSSTAEKKADKNS